MRAAGVVSSPAWQGYVIQPQLSSQKQLACTNARWDDASARIGTDLMKFLTGTQLAEWHAVGWWDATGRSSDFGHWLLDIRSASRTGNMQCT